MPVTPVAVAPKSVRDQAQQAFNATIRLEEVWFSRAVRRMIASEVWLKIAPQNRSSLAQTVGITAPRARGAAKLEQEVAIRSETGMTLTRPIVATPFL